VLRYGLRRKQIIGITFSQSRHDQISVTIKVVMFRHRGHILQFNDQSAHNKK
jgi:hypothetical protein